MEIVNVDVDVGLGAVLALHSFRLGAISINS